MRRPAPQLPDASRALIGYKSSNTKPLNQWERAWHIGWSDVTVSALTTQQSHNSSVERSEVQCALWAGAGGHRRVDKEGVKDIWFWFLSFEWSREGSFYCRLVAFKNIRAKQLSSLEVRSSEQQNQLCKSVPNICIQVWVCQDCERMPDLVDLCD